MIRAGLVGLGKMGISHQAIINAHPEIDLAVVCDTSQYVLEILSKYTGVKTSTDYQRMLDEEKLDCVFIATPSRFHGTMVRQALNKGMHVFCEKPFSLDVAEGQSLVELAAAKGVVNQVGYHYRHVETFREARRLIRAGVLGPIHHVRAEAYGPVVLRPSGGTWRSNKVEGGGCLYDYASHAIDLLNYTIGVPESVGGVILNSIFSRDVDDEVYADCRLPGGASVQLAVNWSDESFRKMTTRLSFWGHNGRITVDRQECQIYLRSAVETPEVLPAGWTIRNITDLITPVWYYLRGEEYSRQIDHFVRCIKGDVAQNDCTFASALDTDRVVHTIARQAGSTGSWAPVEGASAIPAIAAAAPEGRGWFGRRNKR